ncbi:cytochrome-c oxidase, subunit VIIa [Lecanosticta acicola]|uniref:Cytochrome c oxidase subunit 9, mitochondrial n=1 Tax=Lecanosticta acicola TaxID=111012 RepID=A0AAI8VUV4_9PEZI|nr:cytochrome-c oxidase, subunit VIIa [Lecanosticta acicola]
MVKPITGMLRRGLVLDLSVAFGLGTASGYFWWYGFHVPSVRRRDLFYAKLEDQRADAFGQVPK